MNINYDAKKGRTQLCFKYIETGWATFLYHHSSIFYTTVLANIIATLENSKLNTAI